MKLYSLHECINMRLVSRADVEAEGVKLKEMNLIDRAKVMSRHHDLFSGEQSLRRGWEVDASGIARKEKKGEVVFGYSMGRGSIWMLRSDIQLV